MSFKQRNRAVQIIAYPTIDNQIFSYICKTAFYFLTLSYILLPLLYYIPIDQFTVTTLILHYDIVKHQMLCYNLITDINTIYSL